MLSTSMALATRCYPSFKNRSNSVIGIKMRRSARFGLRSPRSHRPRKIYDGKRDFSQLRSPERCRSRAMREWRPRLRKQLLTQASEPIEANKKNVPERDLHKKPFDEGTKTKLEIYRGYV